MLDGRREGDLALGSSSEADKTITIFNDLNTEPGFSMNCSATLDQNLCSTGSINFGPIANLKPATYTDPKADCRVLSITCEANRYPCPRYRRCQVPCALQPSENATYFFVSTAGKNGDSCSIGEA